MSETVFSISQSPTNGTTHPSNLSNSSGVISSFPSSASSKLSFPIPSGPIPLMQQQKSPQKQMEEESSKMNTKIEISATEKLTQQFNQITWTVNAIEKALTEEMKTQETTNEVISQLGQIRVHLEQLLDQAIVREHHATLLESQVQLLKREVESLKGGNPLSEEEKMLLLAIFSDKDDDGTNTGGRRNGTDEFLASRALSLMMLKQQQQQQDEKESTIMGIPVSAAAASLLLSKEKLKKTKRRKSNKRADAKGEDDDEEEEEDTTEPESESNVALLNASVDQGMQTPGTTQKQKRKRGKLPDSATNMLKQWILEHRYHPYPTEEEKAMMCMQTQLTMNQINNWFTNARRRFLQKQPGGTSSTNITSPTTPTKLDQSGISSKDVQQQQQPQAMSIVTDPMSSKGGVSTLSMLQTFPGAFSLQATTTTNSGTSSVYTPLVNSVSTQPSPHPSFLNVPLSPNSQGNRSFVVTSGQGPVGIQTTVDTSNKMEMSTPLVTLTASSTSPPPSIIPSPTSSELNASTDGQPM